MMAYVVALHAGGHLVTLNVDFVRLPRVLGVFHQCAEQVPGLLDILAQVLALRPLWIGAFALHVSDCVDGAIHMTKTPGQQGYVPRYSWKVRSCCDVHASAGSM